MSPHIPFIMWGGTTYCPEKIIEIETKHNDCKHILTFAYDSEEKVWAGWFDLKTCSLRMQTILLLSHLYFPLSRIEIFLLRICWGRREVRWIFLEFYFHAVRLHFTLESRLKYLNWYHIFVEKTEKNQQIYKSHRQNEPFVELRKFDSSALAKREMILWFLLYIIKERRFNSNYLERMMEDNVYEMESKVYLFLT